jgi:UDP-N-acetylmuramoyl-tripeptide--D-alanyl-D-alanine ligase
MSPSEGRGLLTEVWRTAQWRVFVVYKRIALWLAPLYRGQLRRVVFIGVTGSCGKSTTKELIAAVLSSQFKGYKNPGSHNRLHYIASTILRVKPSDEFCVLEIAAAIRGEIIPLERPLNLVKPRIGVITNIGSDHISAFGSVEAIAAEKGKLIAALPSDGTAILNADDPNVLAMRSRCAGRVITYGLAPEAMVRAENVSAAWPERLSFTVCFHGQCHPVRTQLPGAHLVQCALAAVAVGLAMGLPLTVAAQAISTVPPFPRRMSPVIRDDGVTFIQDDAKAPLWSIPAVLDFMKDARAGRKIVVIGTISDYTGNSDRAYVSVARQALAAADQVVFVGSRASKSLKARRYPHDDALQAFPSVEAACAQLHDFFRQGDLVLLKGINHDHLEALIGARSTGKARAGVPLTGPSIQAVVGLGNPGAQYRDTPHNVGQTTLDFLARSLRAEWVREEQVMLARIELQGRIVYLIKPLTYVNVTGPMLSQLARRLNFAVDQCVLVHDDMDLPLGALRVRMKGGDGGHRGVRSIQRVFGSDALRRVKIGVGRPEQKGRAAAHVLTTFAPTEMPVIARACTEAAQRILELLEIPAPMAHPPGQESARDNTATVVTAHEEAPRS